MPAAVEHVSSSCATSDPHVPSPLRGGLGWGLLRTTKLNLLKQHRQPPERPQPRLASRFAALVKTRPRKGEGEGRASFFAVGAIIILALLAWPALAHDAAHDERLPAIGPAPAFSLTAQDGATVSLGDFRGKTVVVTFIFASCTDTCPMLTDKMARVQDKLGEMFGKNIIFISITVDPERDTPEVLKQYADSFGANPAGWFFLTGEPSAIGDVLRRYGVYVKKTPSGDIDHTFLTSLIDSKGILRVQYLGVRFDLEEFRRDLLGLVDESGED